MTVRFEKELKNKELVTKTVSQMMKHLKTEKKPNVWAIVSHKESEEQSKSEMHKKY